MHLSTTLQQFLNSIEKRFGVYLDTIHGFRHNLTWTENLQQQVSRTTRLIIDQLDQRDLIRGNGPPSQNLAESKKREIHRMTQGEFKKIIPPKGEINILDF